MIGMSSPDERHEIADTQTFRKFVDDAAAQADQRPGVFSRPLTWVSLAVVVVVVALLVYLLNR